MKYIIKILYIRIFIHLFIRNIDLNYIDLNYIDLNY